MSVLQISVRDAGTPQKIIIELKGSIDTSRSVENLYNLITKSSALKMVISMSQVDYVNSAGCGELFLLNHKAKQEGKTLVFSQLSDKVRSVFEHMGGLNLLSVVANEADALKKLG